MLNVLAWIEIHRKQLMGGFVALLVIFGAVYLYRQLAAQRELAGNAALLSLRHRANQPEASAKAAEYLKVAEEHGSTSAALRARLLAAGAFFNESRYAEAQAEFVRVLDADGSGVLGAQAAYGIAACLDALDKTDEAATKYQDVISRYSDDSVAVQARLSLARLHESKKQPESALRLYDEVLRDREGSAFAQLATQAKDDLMRANPQLAATNAAPASTGAK